MAEPANTTSSTEWPGAFGILSRSKEAVFFNRNTMLLLFIITLLLSVPGTFKGGVAGGIDTLASIASIFVSMAVIVATFAGFRGQKMSFEESFKPVFTTLFFKYFATTILTAVLVIVSILLFVIPFFYVLPRLLLAPYICVDKKLGPIDSIKQSWAMTSGHSIKAWGIIGATLLFAISMIVLIGFYFIFIYQAAFVILYSYISNQSSEVSEISA